MLSEPGNFFRILTITGNRVWITLNSCYRVPKWWRLFTFAQNPFEHLLWFTFSIDAICKFTLKWARTNCILIVTYYRVGRKNFALRNEHKPLALLPTFHNAVKVCTSQNVAHSGEITSKLLAYLHNNAENTLPDWRDGWTKKIATLHISNNLTWDTVGNFVTILIHTVSWHWY